MGTVEEAVDAAASFIGPFMDNGPRQDGMSEDAIEASRLVRQALSHLQTINTADLDADPDAPYDASLAGVVYGLLDVITSYGILPCLSPGVAFSSRPQSVLKSPCPVLADQDVLQLSEVTSGLIPTLDQKGSGVQSLLVQRILPDIISALAELSFSPIHRCQNYKFAPIFEKVMEETPTSRLLPILSTFTQQSLPPWLKPLMSKHLAMIPLRPRGVRHIIEFLSLSYLSKISHVSHEGSGPQSQIPIPLEAVSQASRLLVLAPSGMNQDDWIRQIAPQLWALLDGDEGVELSRAAGQIIAGGVLSKRATGAPNTIGWQLFALPLLQTICPEEAADASRASDTNRRVIVHESKLMTALKRLSTIASSYSHIGLFKRLIGPILLPLWALLNHALERPAIDKKWIVLSKNILCRYTAVACDPDQIDRITTNIFWDGDRSWVFRPGSGGGIEIRCRSGQGWNDANPDNVLVRIGGLDRRTRLLVSLLEEGQPSDNNIGSIFLQVTKRWLLPRQGTSTPLTDDLDIDPLTVLVDAKISEAMGTKFGPQLARSPEHVIELMSQILANTVHLHQFRAQKLAASSRISRVDIGNITETDQKYGGDMTSENDAIDEALVSFAISILSTLISSSDFKQTTATRMTLDTVIASLNVLSKEQSQTSISTLVSNSARSLLQLLQPTSTSTQGHATDEIAEHRSTLRTVLADLTSSEPPDRTWALTALRKLIQDPVVFAIADVPSMVHLILSASIADPEPYVHMAAMPVMVDIAVRAPDLVVRVLIDAFIDVDEYSLQLSRERRTEEKDGDLRQALDFRLRVGEILNNFVLNEGFFRYQGEAMTQHGCLKQICEACLSLASRRGKRTETLSTRTQHARAEQEMQAEGEAAWGGPIPNLLDPEGENPQDQAERDALLKIVQGWEDTGIEEDVRVRASALSVLSTVLEHRLVLLGQITVDAALQMVLLVLTLETTEPKGMLRRAAVMVIMGLLRGLSGALEIGNESVVGLDMAQQREVTRVLEWVRDEDVDVLVRSHAASVLEGLETWHTKKLYQVRERGLGLGLGAGMGLEVGLRGLDVQPDLDKVKGQDGRKKLIVEELA
jgi:hypothetical protein